jgi:LacI family transcriptional regulator
VPTVDPEKRRKVLDAARELGYGRQVVVPKTRTLRKTGAIGIIVRDIGNPFYTKIAKNADQALRAHSHQVVLASSEYEEQRELHAAELLIDSGVDGILIMPIHEKTPTIAFLTASGLPFVVLNCHIDAPDVCSISSDGVAGAHAAVTHLLELGHRSLMVVGGRNAANNRDRRIGVRNAWRDWDRPSADLIDLDRTGTDLEAGYKALTGYVSKHGVDALPTAIFAINDSVAYGILDALDVSGVAVPGRVSVVGYDNLDMSRQVRVPLTTVDQQEYHMGAMAVQQLLDSSAPALHVWVKPTLILRESTAPPFDRPQDAVARELAARSPEERL